MTSFRALLGLVCVLGLAAAAPSANAAQTLGLVGLSGHVSDAAGNIYTLDGGTNYFGLDSDNTLSFSNLALNLTENERLVIIDGGVVNDSHIITFRLIFYPNNPFTGHPSAFTLTGVDSLGNPNSVDQVLNGGGPGWSAGSDGSFFNVFTTLELPPTVTDFTLNFDVPEPSTWAMLMLGVGAIGAGAVVLLASG